MFCHRSWKKTLWLTEPIHLSCFSIQLGFLQTCQMKFWLRHLASQQPMPCQCPPLTRICHHLRHIFVFRKPSMVIIHLITANYEMQWVGIDSHSSQPMICFCGWFPYYLLPFGISLTMAVGSRLNSARGAQANLPVKPVAPRTTTSKVMAEKAVHSGIFEGFLEPKVPKPRSKSMGPSRLWETAGRFVWYVVDVVVFYPGGWTCVQQVQHLAGFFLGLWNWWYCHPTRSAPNWNWHLPH